MSLTLLWASKQVAHNQRGRNASQANIGGLGVGAFNDRFRDAVNGGSPFASPKYQGWATGLATQPSSFSKVRFAPAVDVLSHVDISCLP